MKKIEKKIIPGVEITDLAVSNKGVCRVDGMIIFVEKTVTGDVADIELFRKKRNYGEARLLKILKPSDKRTEPVCSHFGTCGGCTLQNMKYEEQLALKQKIVSDAFRHIGMIDEIEVIPIIPSTQTFFYRNKLEYSFTSNRWLSEEEIASHEIIKDRDALGFHIPGRFDKVFQVDKCWMQMDPSNSIRNFIFKTATENNLEFFDAIKSKGFLRTLTIRTTSTGEIMVVLVFSKDDEGLRNLILEALKSNFPGINSIYYIINEKKNDSLYDLTPVLFHGSEFILEIIDGIRFRIGPKSFFQTNTLQTEKMHKAIAGLARINSHQHVYDLYSGVGTISLYLAGLAGKVTGIETVGESVVEAETNALLNGILNASFFQGEVEKILTDDFFKKEGKPDLIVVDPPRSGLHIKVIEAILNSGSPEIIYVSCNPATQARDLKLLAEKYKTQVIQSIDMFPQTMHVENIALLKLQE